MNALVIADRPPSQSILTTLESNEVDLIITLGDLEHAEIRELQEVTHIPKIGVYGNHCSGTYMKELGIINLHEQSLVIGPLSFAGLEGCVRYKESPYAPMFTQEEASSLLANAPHVDVFISHCPPFGVNDDPEDQAHTGFIGLRDYVLRQKPRLLLHGHTYPQPGTEVRLLGETRIEYVQGERIIMLNP